MKGAAAAAVNTVPIANGSGSTAFGKLTHTSLTTTGNPFGAQLLHIKDQVSSGVAAQTLTTGWNTRVLQTVVTNEISGASLSANTITLPAGTYWIDAQCLSANPTVAQARIYNQTTSSALMTGVANGGQGNGGVVPISVKGRFTLSGTSVIRLDHYVAGVVAWSAGYPNSLSAEVYAEVIIWKVA